jgi:KaiC/GvpD/RAD55 family RecA-like ATPase
MPARNDNGRVPTGIKGLDDIMGKGFETNSVNLIRGGTGTGKTIFCLQFLYNGAKKYDEPGVYISFSEPKESIYDTASGVGCDLEELEKKGKFAFIKHSPHEVERILKEGGGTLRDTIDDLKAKRLVIDSLTAYALFFENPYRASEGILGLFDILKGWDITSIVTDEKEVDLQSLESGRLGFLSDSIIHMYYLRTDSVRVRGLEIVKMRHTSHSDRILPFRIEKNGIVVYPDMQLLV